MKHILFTTILLAVVVLAACRVLPSTPAPVPTPAATSTADEETIIRELVENFGARLQNVSLLAPDAAQEIQKQYSEFVSPALLETWMQDVSKAPGRKVSSPWPERIEITSLTKDTPDRYAIQGSVIEVTSTELSSGGAADKIPFHMIVERRSGRWLISAYTEEL